jgi:UDP-N-acetyl-D-mannosaminuronic acid dehydrogenase
MQNIGTFIKGKYIMFNKIISVIGLGYIGLPTAAMFASKGVNVVGVDVNADVVECINSGNIHIIEPGLGHLVKEAVNKKSFRATTKTEQADIFIIAVPTPFIDNTDNSYPEPDLSFIQSACLKISKVLKKGDLVILESTSPVGTTEKISSWMAGERNDLKFPHTHQDKSDIRIAYCPERVLPGNVINELVSNDRVIGGMSKACSELAIDVYNIFVNGECIITTDKTAEMAKLTENASRDVQIAFANELSVICDDLGINVWELIKIANHHPRVNILQPGPGVGGHCIAVDPWFIISKSPKLSPLLKTARKINDSKPEWVVNKVKLELSNFLLENPSKSINDISLALLGLSFKPDIDDLRESPAIEIANTLSELDLKDHYAVEPNISELNDKVNNKIKLIDIEYALKNTDLIIVLVDHKEFKNLSANKMRSYKGIVIDTRGIWKK